MAVREGEGLEKIKEDLRPSDHVQTGYSAVVPGRLTREDIELNTGIISVPIDRKLRKMKRSRWDNMATREGPIKIDANAIRNKEIRITDPTTKEVIADLELGVMSKSVEETIGRKPFGIILDFNDGQVQISAMKNQHSIYARTVDRNINKKIEVMQADKRKAKL